MEIVMEDLAVEYLERSEAVGRLIRAARVAKQATITQCAEAVGTTRRRYIAIEDGKVRIGLVEADILAEFLEIPLEILRTAKRNLAATPRKIVHMTSGETIQIIVTTTSRDEPA